MESQDAGRLAWAAGGPHGTSDLPRESGRGRIVEVLPHAVMVLSNLRGVAPASPCRVPDRTRSHPRSSAFCRGRLPSHHGTHANLDTVRCNARAPRRARHGRADRPPAHLQITAARKPHQEVSTHQRSMDAALGQVASVTLPALAPRAAASWVPTQPPAGVAALPARIMICSPVVWM